MQDRETVHKMPSFCFCFPTSSAKLLFNLFHKLRYYMANIKTTFRLSENNLTILKDLSKKTGTTINKILNFIVSKQNDTNYLDDYINDSNEDNKVVRIKINSKEYEFLKKQAELDGLNHINSEVKYRLLNTIYRNKYFTNIELSNFMKTRTEVNAVGRNLNQLLRLLQTKSSLNINDEVFSNMIKDLDDKIKNITLELEDIILKSKDRY